MQQGEGRSSGRIGAFAAAAAAAAACVRFIDLQPGNCSVCRPDKNKQAIHGSDVDGACAEKCRLLTRLQTARLTISEK
jgi:hypothetical protein